MGRHKQLEGRCLKKTKVEPSRNESNNRPHLPPGKVSSNLKEKKLSNFAKVVDLQYNVVSGQYTQFIDNLRAKLADHPKSRKVEHRSVLAKECPKYPARWMFIHLTAGTYGASLAIRDDNLYLKAFKSKEQWYEIGLKKQNPEPLLPKECKSKVLKCGDHYGSLAGGDKDKKLVKKSLMELKLGEESMIEAVRKLASYVWGADIPKQALAQLIVMICEAARMTPHHEKVKQAWVRASTVHISELEVDYLWNWGRMSGALLAWWDDQNQPRRQYEWPDKEFFVGEPNIFCAGTALSVVQLVKNSRPPKRIRNKESPAPADGGEEGNRSPSNSTRPADNNKKHGRDQTPSQPPPSQGAGGGDHAGTVASSRQRQAAEYTACHGRRLVEVFALAVSADSDSDSKFLIVKTIAVYDGKRGQIIYKHEDREEHDEEQNVSSLYTQTLDNLVLTGPYTAISAEGSFAIEIEISKGGKLETFYGEWDCSDDENEDDELLCQKLGSVYITYAVLSNALEANVEFKLPLSADSNIHNSLSGEIIAYNQMFKVGSMLFNRDSNDKAELPSDSIIPLARSVFAVPIGCQIEVKMKLSATTPDREVVFNGTVEFYCGDSTKVLPTANGGVEVNITWYPGFTDCEEKIQSSPSGTSPRELVYNMMDGNYATFMTEFRNLLAEHPHSEEVEGHPVLARQRATQPARWIHLKLVAGEETTTLAIRDDNVYLTGFMNKWGDWYELSGPTERSARMLPEEYNSSLLEWWRCYGEMGDSMVDRKTRLDQSFATNAVHMLSCYPNNVMTSTSVVGIDALTPPMALAGLTVMVCESARMSSHYDTISQRLNKECTLNVWQVKYLRNWKRMSRALLNWKSNGFINWPSDPQVEDMQITLGHEALRVVQLLLNWSPRMRAAAASPGRCLVELLAVTADLGIVGTTITVFDGKRGQIIYTHQQADDHASNLDSQGNLVLTGPYRPISADGCFAIQVNFRAAAHGDDVGDSIFWEWDGYDEVCSAQVDNNPQLNRSISTGPGRTVNVSYAVMSNAIAGTVQVSLPLAEHTLVYGEITADNGTMRRVLFSSTADVAVAVEAILPDRSIVPLARPVIAVPLGQWLNIHVRMHAHPDQVGILHDFEGTVQFDGHSSRQFRTIHGIVEIRIIWYPKFPSRTGCS